MIFLFFFESCKSPTAPKGGGGGNDSTIVDSTAIDTAGNISLSIAEVSCTEAWINISSNGMTLPAQILINRNNNEAFNFTLAAKDTAIYDSTLSANQSYVYSAVKINKKVNGPKSNNATASTLDTTDHNFNVVQVQTFGGAASSYLKDVAIIDENNIYAVGTIYEYDSTGQIDPYPYNMIHWDGKKWEVKKLFYNTSSIINTIDGIYIFSPNDFYLAAGSIFHWDGSSSSTQLVYSRLNLSDSRATIEKLYGNTSSQLYGVGDAGTIVVYNGTWQQIQSGTTTNIDDIYGIGGTDPMILCAVSNVVTAGDNKILSITNSNTAQPYSWNTGKRVQSIWFEDSRKIFTCGGGVYISSSSGNWVKQQSLPSVNTNRIRGMAKNDVFVAGDFGMVAHFNGVTWKVYDESAVSSNFYSMDYKNNIMAAVGESSSGKAVIVIMKR